MRRLLCLFLMFVVPGTVSAAAKEQTPALVAEEKVFDFGVVAQGSVVSHQFVLKNSSERNLQITKISSACGCTAGVLASAELAPGASTTLRVEFDTTGFHGDKVKTVRLYTDDPNGSNVVFTLRGRVEPPIVFDPWRINFGKVRRGQPLEQLVKISAQNPKFAISELRPRSKDIKAELLEGGSAGSDKAIKVFLPANLALGLFRGRLAVKTNDERFPVVNIPVLAEVVGDLELQPSFASFGLLALTEKDKLMREVILVNHGSQPIELLSLTSEHPKVAVSFVELEAGKRFLLQVKLEDLELGALRSRVLITSSHPDLEQQKLFLPVSAVVVR